MHRHPAARPATSRLRDLNVKETCLAFCLFREAAPFVSAAYPGVRIRVNQSKSKWILVGFLAAEDTARPATATKGIENAESAETQRKEMGKARREISAARGNFSG